MYMSLPDNIVELAKIYLLNKERYEQTVRKSIRTSLGLTDKNVFWTIIDDFTGIIHRNIDTRDDCVRFSTQELMRKTWLEDAETYSFDDMPAFIHTYGQLKERLAKQFSISLFDNFANVIDALPLLGKSTCLEIMKKVKITSIESIPFHDQKIMNIVLYYENFVEQNLEQSYSDRLCEALLYGDKEFERELLNL